jgi:cytochrome c nitrite reductase small subunit
MLKKLLRFNLLPQKLRIPIIISIGAISGFFVVLVKTTNAVSFLNEKPETCINCHVMQSHYSTWSHSSHRENTTCVDCHLPHDNIAHKYYVKARDGMKDVVMFSFRLESNVIKATEKTKEIIEGNCIFCHDHLMANVHPISMEKTPHHWKGKRCWDCHREVPHGRIRGLPSVIKAEMHLKNDNPVPNWLIKQLKNEKEK